MTTLNLTPAEIQMIKIKRQEKELADKKAETELLLKEQKEIQYQEDIRDEVLATDTKQMKVAQDF
jgi:hypothetical protein